MDDSGNILVKRIAKSNVYVKLTSEENAIASDILKLPNGQLESEKPVKLFDMKKFQQNVSREMRRAYPDRRKLECQCISAIAFVRNENDILDCPCWIMLINIVAMDMLKSKMPPSKYIFHVCTYLKFQPLKWPNSGEFLDFGYQKQYCCEEMGFFKRFDLKKKLDSQYEIK